MKKILPMKWLPVLFICTLLSAVASGQDAKPVFDISKLSNEQKAACQKFRDLIMTLDQLVQLIGEPDFPDLCYELGQKQFDCEVCFSKNDNNHILDFIYANCAGHFRK
jgi:hypothetical protein